MWAMPFLKAPYCNGVSCEGSAFKLQAFRSLSQGLNVILIDLSFSELNYVCSASAVELLFPPSQRFTHFFLSRSV